MTCAMSAPETVTRVGNVSGVHTDLVVVTKYSDKTFICVTQLEKFGTWLQLERESVKRGEVDTCPSSRHVYCPPGTRHGGTPLSRKNIGREDSDDQANHLCSWSEKSDCTSSLRVSEICDRKLVKAKNGKHCQN